MERGIIYHEREEESVKVEKNILSRVCILVCRCKVRLFPHARWRAPCGFFSDGFPRYMLCICVNAE